VGAPILVNDELMASEAKILDLEDDDDEAYVELEIDEDEVEEADLVAELREFLDNVNPEDFGS
jgi:bifunctional DNase/RNase